MKQTIEVDIPEGWEFVRFGNPENGEHFICYGKVQECCVVFFKPDVVIVRPVELWKIPTKLDLLNRDSIECRWRGSSTGKKWTIGRADAVRDEGNKYHILGHGWVKECEIRDTEPKPEELWRVYSSHDSLCLGIYLTEDSAKKANGTIKRFVEVPE